MATINRDNKDVSSFNKYDNHQSGINKSNKILRHPSEGILNNHNGTTTSRRRQQQQKEHDSLFRDASGSAQSQRQQPRRQQRRRPSEGIDQQKDQHLKYVQQQSIYNDNGLSRQASCGLDHPPSRISEKTGSAALHKSSRSSLRQQSIQPPLQRQTTTKENNMTSTAEKSAAVAGAVVTNTTSRNSILTRKREEEMKVATSSAKRDSTIGVDINRHGGSNKNKNNNSNNDDHDSHSSTSADLLFSLYQFIRKIIFSIVTFLFITIRRLHDDDDGNDDDHTTNKRQGKDLTTRTTALATHLTTSEWSLLKDTATTTSSYRKDRHGQKIQEVNIDDSLNNYDDTNENETKKDNITRTNEQPPHLHPQQQLTSTSEHSDDNLSAMSSSAATSAINSESSSKSSSSLFRIIRTVPAIRQRMKQRKKQKKIKKIYESYAKASGRLQPKSFTSSQHDRLKQLLEMKNKKLSVIDENNNINNNDNNTTARDRSTIIAFKQMSNRVISSSKKYYNRIMPTMLLKFCRNNNKRTIITQTILTMLLFTTLSFSVVLFDKDNDINKTTHYHQQQQQEEKPIEVMNSRNNDDVHSYDGNYHTWYNTVIKGFFLDLLTVMYLFVCGIIHYLLLDLSLVHAFDTLQLGMKLGNDSTAKRYVNKTQSLLVAFISLFIVLFSIAKAIIVLWCHYVISILVKIMTIIYTNVTTTNDNLFSKVSITRDKLLLQVPSIPTYDVFNRVWDSSLLNNTILSSIITMFKTIISFIVALVTKFVVMFELFLWPSSSESSSSPSAVSALYNNYLWQPMKSFILSKIESMWNSLLSYFVLDVNKSNGIPYYHHYSSWRYSAINTTKFLLLHSAVLLLSILFLFHVFFESERKMIKEEKNASTAHCSSKEDSSDEKE